MSVTFLAFSMSHHHPSEFWCLWHKHCSIDKKGGHPGGCLEPRLIEFVICFCSIQLTEIIHFSTKDDETTVDVGDSENRLTLLGRPQLEMNCSLADFSGFSNFKRHGDFTRTAVLLQAQNLRWIMFKFCWRLIIYASGGIIERKLRGLFVKGVQSI